jgi:hypothetical protein
MKRFNPPVDLVGVSLVGEMDFDNDNDRNGEEDADDVLDAVKSSLLPLALAGEEC